MLFDIFPATICPQLTKVWDENDNNDKKNINSNDDDNNNYDNTSVHRRLKPNQKRKVPLSSRALLRLKSNSKEGKKILTTQHWSR